MHDEEPSAYLPLLRLTASRFGAEDRPVDVLSSTLELITLHSLLPDLSTLHLALSLHTTAPRIEAAYSWYEENASFQELAGRGCASWVEWRGKGFCEVEDLKRDMEAAVGHEQSLS